MLAVINTVLVLKLKISLLFALFAFILRPSQDCAIQQAYKFKRHASVCFASGGAEVHKSFVLPPDECLKIGHDRNLLILPRSALSGASQKHAMIFPVPFTSALALIGYTDRRESRVACLIRTRLKSRGW
jgi:hypothetical protein